MIKNISDYTVEAIIADKTSVEVEGVYSNDPNDPGGETMYGVTKNLAMNYLTQLKKLFNWDGDMKNFTKPMAYYVYKAAFVEPLLLNDVIQIHPLIADKLFDISINGSNEVGVTMLQKILNIFNKNSSLYNDIPVDGKMGQTTLSALRSLIAKRGQQGINHVLTLLLCMQGSRYVELGLARSQFETFEFGWAGRVERDMGHYAKLLGLDI